ncbi:LOW QUALITY PROTEIN: AP2/ERF and B3 domain-containing transcription factor At1g51120-like [Argentina anserina]|uniref:LOW QUALITY PROTEIN: AP2/ERF and B3 domain-containing transcription factor At1g51120-like n=1 Tax=Argentina anserina TaxID=57926 RepID=UPI00217641DF|nr:LOW QUALITY PROTEIN: AP2/ERF and B3 domain-containing transcription factor At1g51120-like [Potentilla anserina]
MDKMVSNAGTTIGRKTSKFKGVVPQKNGQSPKWGAQIYAANRRVCLGTFDSEEKAAKAYDSAAIKLRNGECQRNFAWTNETDQEPFFQNLYSQEAVLNMIKDGSYQARFEGFLKARQAAVLYMQRAGMPDLQQLFQKELTPSDVGKLNRLVIPKIYATKYFPRIDESMQEGLDVNPAPAVKLSFYDEDMRRWHFRYCYWKSRQSFVFSKGWSRFAKQRKLKANDTIRFYECRTNIRERDEEVKLSYLIKIDPAENSGIIVECGR